MAPAGPVRGRSASRFHVSSLARRLNRIAVRMRESNVVQSSLGAEIA
jgi:hypothetical protein